MLRDEAEVVAVESDSSDLWAPASPRASACDWRAVDRALRAICKRRAALDADEARWLREAEIVQIWRPLGMVSMLDYLERVLGYAPRTAQDRLRVARALGDLPRLTASLASAKLPFSAVRELTRVATPATESSWIAAATGKNLRQIEELVADHRPGDRPDDPADPEARTRVVRFELSAGTFALLRQARAALDDEHGTNLSDDELVAALSRAILDGASQTEPTGRAKFQIAVTVCSRCRQGWQDGAGARIAIDDATVSRAMCDAQHIGSIDGEELERAYQDIPPSVARLVWRRDGGRCRVDGCRSARGLEIHHIIHREHGGTHDAGNLILACSSCHLAHHRGALTISGTAAHLTVQRAAGANAMPASSAAHAHAHAHVGAPNAAVAPVPAATDAAHAHAHLGAPNAAVAPVPAATDAATDVGHERPAAPAHVGAANAAVAPAPAAPMAAEPGAAALVPAATVGAPDMERERSAVRAHVGAPSQLDTAILRTQAKVALTGLGWKPAIAKAAVAAAASTATGWTLERLIYESLRRCPVPGA